MALHRHRARHIPRTPFTLALRYTSKGGRGPNPRVRDFRLNFNSQPLITRHRGDRGANAYVVVREGYNAEVYVMSPRADFSIRFLADQKADAARRAASGNNVGFW